VLCIWAYYFCWCFHSVTDFKRFACRMWTWALCKMCTLSLLNKQCFFWNVWTSWLHPLPPLQTWNCLFCQVTRFPSKRKQNACLSQPLYSMHATPSWPWSLICFSYPWDPKEPCSFSSIRDALPCHLHSISFCSYSSVHLQWWSKAGPSRNTR